MPDGLNRVTAIGYLGKEPELRFTQSNQAVLNFSIACSESWFDKTANERKERTEWVSIVLWGPRAAALGKLLTKGDRVCIEGRLQTRSWEDKQGDKRYTTEVVATNVLLLGGKRKQEDGAGDAAGGGERREQFSDSQIDDEIPF